MLRLLVSTQGGDISCVPKPEDLRMALLNRDTSSSIQICNALYDEGQKLKFAYHCASDVSEWCTHSKRVYCISNGLCQMLMATDLPDFSAEGIKFISQSYVIQLEKPIMCTNGRAHDFFICVYVPGKHVLSIRSYPAEYEQYHPLSEDKKRSVERDAQSKHPRFQEFVDKMNTQAGKRFVVGYSCYLLSGNTLQESILANAPADEREEWKLMYQLVLGVNLYLQSARAENIGDSEVVSFVGQQTQKSKMREPITSEAQLFELATSSAFTQQSHAGSADNEPKGSVKPHFRRGFWRRPKGHGNDPNAHATIWVRPTWVRADKIDAGEHPRGSSQTITIIE